MDKKLIMTTILTILVVAVSVSASYDLEDFKFNKCPLNAEINGKFYGCGAPKPTLAEADEAGIAQAKIACEDWCKTNGGTGGIVSQCNKLGGKSGSAGKQSVMKCDSCTCIGLAPAAEEIGGTFFRTGPTPF